MRASSSFELSASRQVYLLYLANVRALSAVQSTNTILLKTLFVGALLGQSSEDLFSILLVFFFVFVP